jgi:hypothetical protein
MNTDMNRRSVPLIRLNGNIKTSTFKLRAGSTAYLQRYMMIAKRGEATAGSRQ